MPVGRLPVAQMRAITDIAEHFGTGEVRLTVWQNLILPNIRSKRLAEVQDALLAAASSFLPVPSSREPSPAPATRAASIRSRHQTRAVALANFLGERSCCASR